jgi:hypothetical protein
VIAGRRACVLTTRLRRYAIFTLAYSTVLVLLLAGVVPETVGFVFVVVFALGLVWSWGAFLAHLALNDALDDVDRRRWTIAFYFVPPSMAAYWWIHVRGRGVD